MVLQLPKGTNWGLFVQLRFSLSFQRSGVTSNRTPERWVMHSHGDRGNKKYKQPVP